MLQHKHCIIRAEILNPPLHDDVSSMNHWFKNLISAIKMNVLLGPYTVYSHMENNRGFTGICAIETSSITMHCWDEQSPSVLQLDVYTCADLDVNTVFDHVKQFNPVSIEYTVIDRDKTLKITDQGTILFN